METLEERVARCAEVLRGGGGGGGGDPAGSDSEEDEAVAALLVHRMSVQSSGEVVV